MAFMNRSSVEALGFASLGKNVLISERSSIYGASRIEIGSNVRIDDFCVLSAGTGGISLGSYIHIAVFTSLIGAGRIKLRDYCNLSSRVSIYSSNDDYSGRYMTNPMVPSEFTGVSHADVELHKHVIVGSGSVILPGVSLFEGVAIGSLSIVKHDCAAFGVYAGVPLRRISERSRDILELEKKLIENT